MCFGGADVRFLILGLGFRYIVSEQRFIFWDFLFLVLIVKFSKILVVFLVCVTEVAQREDEADDLHLHSSLWSMTSAFIRADAALSPFSLQ